MFCSMASRGIGVSNMRLIDVDELINELRKLKEHPLDLACWNCACRAVVDAPTIDPVRHGKWLANPVEFYLYCSECNSRQESGLLTMYCPNCGAKMDGE